MIRNVKSEDIEMIKKYDLAQIGKFDDEIDYGLSYISFNDNKEPEWFYVCSKAERAPRGIYDKEAINTPILYIYCEDNQSVCDNMRKFFWEQIDSLNLLQMHWIKSNPALEKLNLMRGLGFHEWYAYKKKYMIIFNI